MSDARIAKRYARPILELAIEQNQLEKVKADMEMLADLCKSNRDLLNLLKSPIIPHLRKATALNAVFKGKVTDMTLIAIDMIARKSREGVLPEIANQFIEMYNEKMGYQQASVTTTFALDAGLKKAFEGVVEKITNKKAVLTEKIDAELIGGFTLRLGDRQIDESVSGMLKELKIKFTNDK